MKKLQDAKRGKGLTRRKLLRGTGIVLGGLAVAGRAAAAQPVCSLGTGDCYDKGSQPERDHYSVFENLDPIDPILSPVKAGELRITFMGSAFPPARPAQQMMSVFVEVGETATTKADQFIFDCGSGVMSNYNAMNIGFKRMDKVFINHLHGDHMSDLTAIYCFGPATDRKKPLYVWGPGPSGVPNPKPPPQYYEDGTTAYLRNLREACRWHTESFSFLSTAVQEWTDETRKWGDLARSAVKVGDDPAGDGFALYSIEFGWSQVGVAYENHETGVKITHYPVVHSRKGSVGYKVEWNGLTMMYSSDTRPETISIEQASGKTTNGKGVDVFIHEMVPPAEVAVLRSLRLPFPPAPGTDLYKTFQDSVTMAETVYENSHTPQGAYGYLLNQIDPHPRLAVAAHFPVADDTVACAKRSVAAHCDWVRWLEKLAVRAGDRGWMTWACDLMVIEIDRNREIRQYRADVNPYAPGPLSAADGTPLPPKYPSPTSDIDTTNVIQPGPKTYCKSGF